MKVLLDTHALLWWVGDAAKLSRRARELIERQDSSVLVSAATAWEIAIKSAAGKLDAGPLVSDFRGELLEEGFEELAITSDHAVRAGLLPGPLKDPFDRMLIAQAQAENAALVSNERRFDRYGVQRIW